MLPELRSSNYITAFRQNLGRRDSLLFTGNRSPFNEVTSFWTKIERSRLWSRDGGPWKFSILWVGPRVFCSNVFVLAWPLKKILQKFSYISDRVQDCNQWRLYFGSVTKCRAHLNTSVTFHDTTRRRPTCLTSSAGVWTRDLMTRTYNLGTWGVI